MLNKKEMEFVTKELEKNIYNKEKWYKILRDYEKCCEGGKNGD